MSRLETLLDEARACTLCAPHLPLGARPLLQLSAHARVLIVGQAPGRRAHTSGVPFDDASGDRLRGWIGLSRECFYDPSRVALLPMGFCYPGSSPSGDLPSRAECARKWRAPLLAHLRRVELTLVVGRHAQVHHLSGCGGVTDCVRSWREYWPSVVPLPHPSPRNELWLRKNPWFARDLLPLVRERLAKLIA